MTDATSRPTGLAASAVLDLCERVEAATRGGPFEATAVAARQRLNGPLRVAIAGRVKAGKSTLLNALVGERLAPTDAGECTRVITWYRRGDGYEVTAQLRSGAQRTLNFRRGDGPLAIDLDDLSPADLDTIEVRWPASTLHDLTLVDTPGLASLDESNSVRTQSFLTPRDHSGIDVDAIIYLIRHVHRRDLEFLDAFMDRALPGASPVNAIAVLSRADEIGGGRSDALQAVETIAQRYAKDQKIRTLCSAVVPVVGLLAETGQTLREDEAAALRKLAATDVDELDLMLLSADEFCDVSASRLTAELRRSLLARLGMYGLRVAVQEIQNGRASTATQLSRFLVELSGVSKLRELLRNHFQQRARILQAKATLELLRSLAAEIHDHDPSTSAWLQGEVERIEASAIEFAQLRAAHLVQSGFVTVSPAERDEVDRVFLAPTATAVVGLPDSAEHDDVHTAAMQGVDRWRARAADPLATSSMFEVCETVARSYERIFMMMGRSAEARDSDGTGDVVR